ncbi:MAG TPA: hypothetical protein HA272_08960 [Methanoregula sp.]|nr:hypothetical protein [Methanoregula sp.]
MSKALMPNLAVLVLLVLVTVPVYADSPEELARGASMDFLGIDLVDPKPAYQKSAQDYINMGNYYRDGCQKLNTRFNDRIFTWAKSRADVLETVDAVMLYQNPSRQLQLMTLNNQQFQKDNPGSFAEYTKMVAWCNAAQDNYNMALSMTASDDHNQRATIYDNAAAVYDTVGDTAAAENARDEAAFARSRQDLKTGSNCLIVTATFGSPMADEVQLVRDFRDNTMQQDYLGSRYVTALNAMYYSFSPFVARAIDQNPSVKPVMRLILAPLLWIVLLSQGIYVALSFSPGLATVAFVLAGGALIGLVYVMPVMLSALVVAVKSRWHVPAVYRLVPFVYLWGGLLALLAIGAVLKIDILTVVSSGLLFVCTVLLTAAAVSLSVSGYLGFSPAGTEE